MEKLVVLNSGGFDSVVLMHFLRETFPDAEIHSLYFSYGQNNDGSACVCAQKVALDLHCIHHEVELPEFKWTRSKFFADGYESQESQYLEMRNLIFLSYALSLCESIGAKSIYMALLDSSVNPYKDTTPAFVGLFNGIAALAGVTLFTPFITNTKADMVFFVRHFHIQPRDFFTCDNNVLLGEPCHTCPDCKEIDEVMREAEDMTPFESWVTHFDPNYPGFQELCMRKLSDLTFVYGPNLVSAACTVKQLRDVVKYAQEEYQPYFHVRVQPHSSLAPDWDRFSLFDLMQNLEEQGVKYDLQLPLMFLLDYSHEIPMYGFTDCQELRIIPDAGFPDRDIEKYVGMISKRTHGPLGVEIRVGEGFDYKLAPIKRLSNKGANHFHFIVEQSSDENYETLFKRAQSALTLMRLAASEIMGAMFYVHLPCNLSYNLLNGADLTGDWDYSISSALEDVVYHGSTSVGPRMFLIPDLVSVPFAQEAVLTLDGHLCESLEDATDKEYEKASYGNVKCCEFSKLLPDCKMGVCAPQKVRTSQTCFQGHSGN